MSELRHRAIRQAGRQRDDHRQVPPRLPDLDAAHDVHEHVVLLQRNAGVTIEHGQQHGHAVRVEPLRNAPRRTEPHPVHERLQLDQQRAAALTGDRNDAAGGRLRRPREEDR